VDSCPICGGDVETKATGRPPRFCSSYCRNVAAGKRRHARRSRALAQEWRALAAQIRAGQRHGYSDQTLERQAETAERQARALLAAIGEAPTEEGDDATPVQVVGGSSRDPRLGFGEKHSSGTPEAASST
jgi:endogenous inhibitor of DNA gyrase (YacG/DUF329 family)